MVRKDVKYNPRSAEEVKVKEDKLGVKKETWQKDD